MDVYPKPKQCDQCPWKISTDSRTILCAYWHPKKRTLRSTKENGVIEHTLHIITCHEYPAGEEIPCVGWIDNQLRAGNNMMLNLIVEGGFLSADYELDGEQHVRFEDTMG